MCPSTTKYFSPSFSYKVILSFPSTGTRLDQSPRIVRCSVLSYWYERSNSSKVVTSLVFGLPPSPDGKPVTIVTKIVFSRLCALIHERLRLGEEHYYSWVPAP